ncbi:hypothetical protein ANCCAN_10545 [Ancylostoma caninum]|uniref:Endonuclease/exonuclease/phosphatase domain-containing protein n=1 Tax=Ancylostoma caninum TaxID=29170 RepID=A0A368GGG7_ANCCA|nr:hypothetical protein ANCCAN_10545 [Ancylostoma caninum]
MTKEKDWATGQQPVSVKPTATETTNKCNTAEKGKPSFTLATGSLILDPIFSPKNIMRIGTWNVRTLNQTKRLAQLFQEFDSYRLDIFGLSEVRCTESGRLNRANKTMLFSECEGRHERGVRLVLDRRAAKAPVGWKADIIDEVPHDEIPKLSLETSTLSWVVTDMESKELLDPSHHQKVSVATASD